MIVSRGRRTFFFVFLIAAGLGTASRAQTDGSEDFKDAPADMRRIPFYQQDPEPVRKSWFRRTPSEPKGVDFIFINAKAKEAYLTLFAQGRTPERSSMQKNKQGVWEIRVSVKERTAYTYQFEAVYGDGRKTTGPLMYLRR